LAPATFSAIRVYPFHSRPAKLTVAFGFVFLLDTSMFLGERELEKL
jgi:hypothetical protein